jgi:hypothetical protein
MTYLLEEGRRKSQAEGLLFDFVVSKSAIAPLPAPRVYPGAACQSSLKFAAKLR